MSPTPRRPLRAAAAVVLAVAIALASWTADTAHATEETPAPTSNPFGVESSPPPLVVPDTDRRDMAHAGLAASALLLDTFGALQKDLADVRNIGRFFGPDMAKYALGGGVMALILFIDLVAKMNSGPSFEEIIGMQINEIHQRIDFIEFGLDLVEAGLNDLIGELYDSKWRISHTQTLSAAGRIIADHAEWSSWAPTRDEDGSIVENDPPASMLNLWVENALDPAQISDDYTSIRNSLRPPSGLTDGLVESFAESRWGVSGPIDDVSAYRDLYEYSAYWTRMMTMAIEVLIEARTHLMFEPGISDAEYNSHLATIDRLLNGTPTYVGLYEFLNELTEDFGHPIGNDTVVTIGGTAIQRDPTEPVDGLPGELYDWSRSAPSAFQAIADVYGDATSHAFESVGLPKGPALDLGLPPEHNGLFHWVAITETIGIPLEIGGVYELSPGAHLLPEALLGRGEFPVHYKPLPGHVLNPTPIGTIIDVASHPATSTNFAGWPALDTNTWLFDGINNVDIYLDGVLVDTIVEPTTYTPGLVESFVLTTDVADVPSTGWALHAYDPFTPFLRDAAWSDATLALTDDDPGGPMTVNVDEGVVSALYSGELNTYWEATAEATVSSPAFATDSALVIAPDRIEPLGGEIEISPGGDVHGTVELLIDGISADGTITSATASGDLMDRYGAAVSVESVESGRVDWELGTVAFDLFTESIDGTGPSFEVVLEFDLPVRPTINVDTYGDGQAALAVDGQLVERAGEDSIAFDVPWGVETLVLTDDPDEIAQPGVVIYAEGDDHVAWFGDHSAPGGTHRIDVDSGDVISVGVAFGDDPTPIDVDVIGDGTVHLQRGQDVIDTVAADTPRTLYVPASSLVITTEAASVPADTWGLVATGGTLLGWAGAHSGTESTELSWTGSAPMQIAAEFSLAPPTAQVDRSGSSIGGHRPNTATGELALTLDGDRIGSTSLESSLSLDYQHNHHMVPYLPEIWKAQVTSLDLSSDVDGSVTGTADGWVSYQLVQQMGAPQTHSITGVSGTWDHATGHLDLHLESNGPAVHVRLVAADL